MERMVYYITTATGAESTTDVTDKPVSSDVHSYWVIAVVLTVVPVFLVIIGLLIAKGKRINILMANY